MKKIEIYNRDTNETFAIIESRKKYCQKDVINYLEQNNFKLILQGKIYTMDNADIYWLAYNKSTKEKFNLWYRELEKDKSLDNSKDIVEDFEMER